MNRPLRRFRTWMRAQWFLLNGGCELCGEKENLKFYDMGRWCLTCYNTWVSGQTLAKSLDFLRTFYSEGPVK